MTFLFPFRAVGSCPPSSSLLPCQGKFEAGTGMKTVINSPSPSFLSEPQKLLLSGSGATLVTSDVSLCLPAGRCVCTVMCVCEREGGWL